MRLTADSVVLAPLDRLWSLTEDVEAWPAITPTMTTVARLDDGPLRTGSRVRVVQPRQRPAVWEVRDVEPPHLFVWGTTSAGMRLVAGHHLRAVADGTRSQLVLDVAGNPAVRRLATPLMQRALLTENDGFRRAAERLVRPAYVDEHWLRLDQPVGRLWEATRRHVDRLLDRGERSRLTGLLATDPPAGFEVAAEQPPHLLSLAGRHRFSDYVLDLRVAADGTGSRITAVTYADFPGARGRAYRAAVVGSRGHVVAVRRILSDVAERV